MVYIYWFTGMQQCGLEWLCWSRGKDGRSTRRRLTHIDIGKISGIDTVVLGAYRFGLFFSCCSCILWADVVLLLPDGCLRGWVLTSATRVGSWCQPFPLPWPSKLCFHWQPSAAGVLRKILQPSARQRAISDVQTSNHVSNEKPWLFRVYRGLYYPVLCWL